MNLYLRLIWLLLTARWRARCDLLGPCRLALRVWPNDLDLYSHVNNGRYYTLLDLARTDLMLRSGLAGKISAAGWFPVVTLSTMRYRKALTLFQRFEIETSVLGWDERSVYLQQRFWQDSEIAASAVIQARFVRKQGGSVPSSELMALAGHHEAPAPLPQWLQAWALEAADPK
ncbi:acyl-CoA thioesterase [Chitinolyticbacter albus]|uniref:acyl-CoA thioesterase n=1 Tax=Chitinolyticbacter albus TaxID=2961951 RepID=UPI00210E2B2C|nr:acyl-CoA thioesterase [Chitinolyticbacter albus]